MGRTSGRRKLPGTDAWTVLDYHLSVKELLDRTHDRAAMFLFDQWSKRTNQRFACAPPRQGDQ